MKHSENSANKEVHSYNSLNLKTRNHKPATYFFASRKKGTKSKATKMNEMTEMSRHQ